MFYVDDRKLFARNDEEFSNDIAMDFGLDLITIFVREKLWQTASVKLDTDTTIKELNPQGCYKYLGINEGDGIQHTTMKEKVRKEHYRRIRHILKIDLNFKNCRIEAIITLALLEVQYSFNIINWNLTELQRLDKMTRKLLTSKNMHHPKADADRLYLLRSNGGRGMMQANGLVERFHRCLKESLTTRLNRANWIDQLPWEMLGICTAPEQFLNTSSTEMVYGAPLAVLGEFLLNTKSDPDVKRYLAQLRDSVGQLRPIPMSTPGTPRSSVPMISARLSSCSFDSPYFGPYEVLCPGDKSFKLRIAGRQDTVSIDRLKPAHLDIDSPIQLAQPPNRGRPKQITPTFGKEQSPKSRVTTRRSRAIKTPSRF
uniref:Integrase catalytic domain-containing protein n=1 Tax=Octopus bimaculoides TaxID=37653 RepID=A0A0L8HXS1_OCTBM